MYEFSSEEGDIGPFVSKDNLLIKYKLCPLSLVFDVDWVF